jgi:hypothetical protein
MDSLKERSRGLVKVEDRSLEMVGGNSIAYDPT